MRQGSNPFFYLGLPVTDPASFYGRQQVADSALAVLIKGQGVSIIGPRKIGKTSFLLHLAHSLAAEQDSPAGGYCCVYLNCQGRQNPTAIEFALLLFEELERELAAADRGDALPVLPAAPVFGDIRRALRAVTVRDVHIIFMLDEFEALAQNPHLDVDFFGGLRSLNEGGLREVGNVSYVTASTRALTQLDYAHPEVLTASPSSPFFNVFISAPLGLFARQEAEALLLGTAAKGGMSFELYLDFLIDVAGLHPLLLQVAGHHAYAYIAQYGQLDDPGKERVRAEVAREARHRVWDPSWRKLSPHDQEYLALLTIKQRAEEDTVNRLKESCLIVERDGKLAPFSATFGEFVAGQQVDGLIQVPPLVLDPQQRLALLHGHKVRLSPGEFRLLDRLAREPRVVISHKDLFEHVYPGEHWDNGFHGNRDRLKATLKELNDSLDEAAAATGKPRPQIDSVRGEGYRLLSIPI